MWKSIEINIQNIETETGKATLIKMPNKSKYAGYKFWHPSKLVRSGSNSYSVSIGYSNDFTFKLKKFGDGQYNKFKLIHEIEIGIREFEEAFGCMEDCTKAPETRIEVEHHIPDTKEVKEVEVIDELKY